MDGVKMKELDLNEFDIKNIAYCEKKEGCMLLGKKLGLLPYDVELDMTTDIILEYLYDHLMFCVEKGFPWKDICCIVPFAWEMLQFSKGKSLAETITWYREKSLDLVKILGDLFFKKYTDFVFTTFMPHFKLFQYVLTIEREKMIPHVEVEITPPPSPELLKESKEEMIYHYEQRLSEIEKEETEKEKELSLQKAKIHEETEAKTQELIEQMKTMDEPLTKENLSELIKIIVQAQTSSLCEDLKISVKKTMESLEYKLEKTCIPRPQVLGPPPRYKTKTPTMASKGKGSASSNKPKSAKNTKSK